MRRDRAWEIGASAALLLVVALTAANGYALHSWQLRRQELNARLAVELERVHLSTNAIRRLLIQGADIPTRGSHGWTVLTAAAWTDDLALVKQAVDAGVPVDLPGTNGKALGMAAARGSSEMVAVILGGGAFVDGRDFEGSMTPLISAASVCEPATVRTLIAAGADATLRDGYGGSALDYARTFRPDIEGHVGRAETVRLLEEALTRKPSSRATGP